MAALGKSVSDGLLELQESEKEQEFQPLLKNKLNLQILSALWKLWDK